MASPVDQVPSDWAVGIEVTDKEGETQQCWWDYVIDPYFTWSKGVFLIWLNPETGNHDRIAGVDQYPANQSPDGDYMGKLVDDCVVRFNTVIANMFYDQSQEPHPVDPTTYQYLVTHLAWDGTRFYKDGG